MNYLAFVGSGGPQPPEALAEMNRDFPAYLKEVEALGVRRFGRELTLPETAATVRVREGETLVTDGPFTETKEHVAGIDLLQSDDLDEVIEVEAKSPVARFLPFEIRPVRDGLRFGTGVDAFAQGDDSAGVPYLLIVWADRDPPAGLSGEQAGQLRAECEDWRERLEAEGSFVLGTALGGPETATTLRFRDGSTQLIDGPFLDLDEFITGVEVVRCADRGQAIALAAGHPLARYHAIEVRAFYSEALA